MGKKRGIRETDEKRAGCGILAKKGRQCGIRTPLPDPLSYLRFVNLFTPEYFTEKLLFEAKSFKLVEPFSQHNSTSCDEWFCFESSWFLMDI